MFEKPRVLCVCDERSVFASGMDSLRPTPNKSMAALTALPYVAYPAASHNSV
jgi:hypothetical protein